MKRSEIWTASGGPDYTGKPRPVVVIQDDRYDATQSTTVCGSTTTGVEASISRPEPSSGNGLLELSRMMVDKITTVPKKRLGRRIGALGDEDIHRLNSAIAVFLGSAGR